MRVDDIEPTDRAAYRRSGQGATLALWRSVHLPDIDAAAILDVRRALAGPLALPHRCWPAARRGDAAAAIRVTLDLIRGPDPGATVVDLALSSVLVAAWRGDPAAETVLAHVLAALPPIGRPVERPPAKRRRRSVSPDR